MKLFLDQLLRLKKNVKNMSDEELVFNLKYFEHDLESLSIEAGIKHLFDNYNQYLEIDENLRKEYENLCNKLCFAEENDKNLNVINFNAYELYRAGETKDYYMGTLEERIKSKQLLEELKSQIAELEKKEPRLLNKPYNNNFQVEQSDIAQYYKIQQKIKILKEEINNRKKYSQENQNAKK